MALHRDIYWVGRQWAVTGAGMQAVDQKQKSKFDIEVSRLWEDNLLDDLSAERWFNLEDFNKGLSIAREKYPEPAGRVKLVVPKPLPPEPSPIKSLPPEPASLKPALPREPILSPRQAAPAQPKPAVRAEPTLERKLAPDPVSAHPAPSRETAAPLKADIAVQPSKPLPRVESVRPAPRMVEPPPRAPLALAMRVEGSGAKFSRMWRVRIKG